MMRHTALPDEFTLVARYFAPLAKRVPGAFGLLDDAAVIGPADGNELVVKTDTIVAGIDFPPEEPADFVSRKALRVNLSDLAAKGAVPRAYLLDLVLPESVKESWVAQFADGLRRDQDEYGIQLIGGDSSSTSGPVTVAITAIGEVPKNCMIRRNGARPRDHIFVTGTIGDSALGWALLRGSISTDDADCTEFLIDRYRLPQPRSSLGPKLMGIVTGGIDISDGLVADLRHLCSVSGLSATIKSVEVPVSSAAQSIVARDPQRLKNVLTGGDDYEILFTAPAEAAASIQQLARVTGVPVTAIGTMSAAPAKDEPDVVVLDGFGRPIELAFEGWTHFG